MKSTFSTPTCISCGYDLSGLPLNDNKVHCPECDLTAIPIFRSKPFTYSDMHKRFALRLFLPTSFPTGISLLLEDWIPAIMHGACVLIICIPIILIVLSITSSQSVRDDAHIPPVQVQTRWIIFWQCIYTLPGIVLLGLYIHRLM